MTIDWNEPWPFTPSARMPRIVRAEGRTLFTEEGSEILDAAAGAIICNIGHGRQEVADVTAKAMANTSYIVPPFITPERTALVERLQRDWLPAHLTRVHLSSGGSEAADAACRLAVQYFRAIGDEKRWKVIGRDIAYHGTTIMTLAVGGHPARRAGLENLFPKVGHAPTPYQLRCPLGRGHEGFDLWAADEFEKLVEAEGPDTIAAFIAEPITGSSGGALMPGARYWPRIQEICDKHGILIITDEVMVGFGRTGKRFAAEHFDLKADIMVSGKGLAGGYAPIVGVFATEAVVEPIAAQNGALMFYTYGGHPAACAAADKVLEIMSRENLVARSAKMGALLGEKLNAKLGDHPHVAEIRGQGLFWALELVEDRDTLAHFPKEAAFTARVTGAGLRNGVFFYAGGTGEVRDIVLLGPPFTVSEAELDQMVEVLAHSIDSAAAKMAKPGAAAG